MMDNLSHDRRTITYRCRTCESVDLIKNGHSSSGKQQYLCKSCGRRGIVMCHQSKV